MSDSKRYTSLRECLLVADSSLSVRALSVLRPSSR